MQSHLSNSKLEAEPYRHFNKTPLLWWVWRRSCVYKIPVRLYSYQESSLKLPAPRKIMGRDDTKLKQQFIKNHTEKHCIHTYIRTVLNILTIISFILHARPLR